MKNHMFLAGACLGACANFKRKRIFSFEMQQAPKQAPAQDVCFSEGFWHKTGSCVVKSFIFYAHRELSGLS